MTSYTVYVCDSCDYESRDYNDMRKHEAAHLGLTVDEFEQYNKLNARVGSLTSALCITTNELSTKNKLNKAVKRLNDFKQEHNIN